MSKYVKELVTDYLRQTLCDVEDVVLVNVIGLDANSNNRLRGELAQKNIELLVVKNSLARRATEGTPLSPAFEGVEGSLAIVWGGDDFVSLAKEVVRLAGEKQYEKLQSRGGLMDGERITAERLTEVSKWPSRQEQLALLLGQILSPGAMLAGQLTAAGGALASQIQQQGEGEAEGPADDGAAADGDAAEG